MGVLKTGFVNPKQRRLQVTNPFSLFSQAIYTVFAKGRQDGLVM